jgi:hypothetical protein
MTPTRSTPTKDASHSARPLEGGSGHPGRASAARGRVAAFAAGLTLLAGGCEGPIGGAPLPDAPARHEATSPATPGASARALLGDVTYASTVTSKPGAAAFLNKALKWGRVAVASKAFEICLRESVTNPNGLVYNGGAFRIGPYMPCVDRDPLSSAAKAEQLALARRKSVATNPLTVHYSAQATCGDNALACAPLIGPNATEESFTFFSWLDQVIAAPYNAENGWPYTQTADLIWHEVMHNYGYDHGDGASAAAYCGQPAASFNYQTNTMPYIVGGCVSAVLAASVYHAPGHDIETPCGPNALWMTTDVRETVNPSFKFECVDDPRSSGVGLLSFIVAEANARILDKVTFGDEAGSWTMTSGDTILPQTGDFDGDGREELVVMNAWGLGILKLDTRTEANGSDRKRLEALWKAPWGTTIDGWALRGELPSGDPKLGRREPVIGDFDADGRADLFIPNTQSGGFTVLRYAPAASGMRVLSRVNAGARIGGWRVGKDLAYHPSDVDDAGTAKEDEIVLRSGWGIGILKYVPSSRTWVVVNAVPYGAAIGPWTLRAGDALLHIGNFDGQGGSDLLVKGTSGLGILGLGGTQLAALEVVANGGSIGSWTVAATDAFVAVGDFDKDGRRDFVLKNATGSLLFARRSHAPQSLQALDVIAPWSDFGGYVHAGNLDSTAAPLAVAPIDVNGDGYDDVIATGEDGYRILHRTSTGTWQTILLALWTDVATGGWQVKKTDQFVAAGNVDGIGGAELVLRAP